jgi:ribulose 1,5-bisphosphate carboxylase large subunit-like protein
LTGILTTTVTDRLWVDWDQREELLREIVEERLAEKPAPQMDDYIVATYFFAFRTMQLNKAVGHIAYHSTSGEKSPPANSLLTECTAIDAGIDPFDETGRMGLMHIAFPLKMMLQPDGHLTSTDVLHTTAGAVMFDVYENLDARLVALQLPEKVIRSFPGPAYGIAGLREKTGFPSDKPAFGTILKPTAGILPDKVADLVGQAAECSLFLFVKEDENLYPHLDYSPVKERARLAVQRIREVKERSGGPGLIFAPHISGSPHEIAQTVEAVLEVGANAVMFSESYAGGAVRMVREATRHLDQPPAIYGHNGGIGSRTRAIWREVIDMFARLDGIDFRQTAPVTPGEPFLKPYGREWLASESMLSREMAGIKPTTLVRAGGLDQGNIGLNMADATERKITDNVLYLAGSAINSIKNSQGQSDPHIGATAMMQAVEVHESGALADCPAPEYVKSLKSIAQAEALTELSDALKQRYPEN